MNNGIVNNLKRVAFVTIALLFVAVTGCSDDETAPTQTIMEILQADSNLSMFAEQIEGTSLETALSGSTQYTVFAPDNAAMSTLLTTLGLSDFNSIAPNVILGVLSYHIVASQILYNDLSGSLTTLQGEDIDVTTTTTGEKKLETGASNDASITTQNKKATNGVIHIINTVIVPPTIGELIIATLGTIAQPLLLSSSFTTLSAAIQKADVYAAANDQTPLLGILTSQDATYTVFAPSNAVFTQASITVDSYSGEIWYGLLKNHIISGTHGSADDYPLDQTYTTLAGGTITVVSITAPTNPAAGILTGIALDSNGGGGAEAQIAVLDVLTTSGAAPANNGVINAIAGILSTE